MASLLADGCGSRLRGIELAVLDFFFFARPSLICSLFSRDYNFAASLHGRPKEKLEPQQIEERVAAISRLVSLGMAEIRVSLRADDIASPDSVAATLHALRVGRRQDRSPIGVFSLTHFGARVWQAYSQPKWDLWGDVWMCTAENGLWLPSEFKYEVIVCGGSWQAREQWVERFFSEREGRSVWGVTRLSSGESRPYNYSWFSLPVVHWVRYGVNRPPDEYRGSDGLRLMMSGHEDLRALVKKPETWWRERGFTSSAANVETTLDFDFDFSNVSQEPPLSSLPEDD